MLPSDLIGIWHSGGGWSRYIILFRPDGFGRLEFANLRTTHLFTFIWRCQGDSIKFNGHEQIQLNKAQDAFETLPWNFTATIPASVIAVYPKGSPGHSTPHLADPILDWFPLDYLSGNPAFDVFSPPDLS